MGGKMADTSFNLDRAMDMRQRILRNEEVPPEELRAALAWLRQNRASAAEGGAKRKAKGKVMDMPTNLEDLLG
jgi:hypothetical protein